MRRDDALPVYMGGVIAGMLTTALFFLTAKDEIVFKEWQDLISGLLALLGALITVYALYKQFNAERDTRLVKAMATFSINLSAAHRYAVECVALSEWLWQSFRMRLPGAPLRQSPPDIPVLSKETLDGLADVAAQTDGETRKRISTVLQIYQFQRARLEGFLEKYSDEDAPMTRAFALLQARQHIIDASTLKALIDSLFEEARKNADLRGHIPRAEIIQKAERDVGHSLDPRNFPRGQTDL